MSFTTPTSPVPSNGYTLALGDTTPVELPGLFANTVEVQFYNPNDSTALWFAFVPVVPLRASVTLTVSSVIDVAPYVGDTLTFGAATLTAVGGPRVAGADTFSVDVRAQGTITVAAAPFPVGSTLTLIRAKGPPDRGLTLTCVAGVRVAGSLTFQALSPPAAQAAEIAAAINDSIWSPDNVRSASVLGAVVTCIAGNNRTKRGASGNSAALTPNASTGLAFRTTAPGFVTLSAFTGGVDADNPFTATNGQVTANSNISYASNIYQAVGDATNAVNAVFAGGQIVAGTVSGRLRLWAAVAGTGGNGIVCASSAAAIVIGAASAGGVDYPVPLTASTSIVVGPGERVSLVVGGEGQRNPIRPAAVWASFPGANLGLVGQVSAGGGTLPGSVTFLNRGPA